MTEDQIKHMVDRFLAWKLPETFNPDGGISFVRMYAVDSVMKAREPVGTNLLDAVQAEAMIRHMVDGMPPAPAFSVMLNACKHDPNRYCNCSPSEPGCQREAS